MKKSYRVTRVRAAGRNRDSQALWFPFHPYSLAITVISSSELQLDWVHGSTGQEGYSIERTSSAGGYTGWSEVDRVSGSTVHYHNTGLVAATLYYYRVRAYKGTKYSDYSNVASGTTNP